MLVRLAMISFSFLLAAQPPLPPGAPNARVAGRVVDADTSGPVSGAVVMLVPVAQPFPPRAIVFAGGAGANAGLASGAGSVQGGVVGGIAEAVPVGGIQTRGLPSTEVTVDVNDVTGVRIVVPARNR